MARVQRTLNPLHFEDLEPHRFEDLIRQLSYKFKPWKDLEATGRLGRDGGLDIRGVELAISYGHPENDELTESYGEEPATDLTPTGQIIEREWNIQCKRYQEIGPKLMRDIVDDSIRDKDNPPDGFVLAAACDVSADTMAEFRSAVAEIGIEEAHLWTKAHLEDKLFLPENDHLLFAYFGISLGIRRRGRLEQIRSDISKKRRIMKALDVDVSGHSSYGDALIRDVHDDEYPEPQDMDGFFALLHPNWHPAAVHSFTGFYLAVVRFNHDAWVKPDGAWDLHPESSSLRGVRHRGDTKFWEPLQRRPRGSRVSYLEAIPEAERQLVQEVWLIGFDSIVEVDPIGDGRFPCPHVFCEFDFEDGPYSRGPIYLYSKSSYDGQRTLDPSKRLSLFESLIVPITPSPPHPSASPDSRTVADKENSLE